MRLINVLPVEGKEKFLKDCRSLLRAGETLLIYPEMGRFPDGLGPFQTWAAHVAIENQVTLRTCYLYGTTKGHHGHPKLVVGPELEPRGNPETLTDRLRKEILTLEQMTSNPSETCR